MVRRAWILPLIFSVVLVGLFVSIVSAGQGTTVYLPAVYNQPTPTPTATPTPTPTPAPAFSDNFCNSNSGWPIVSNSVTTVGYLTCEYQIVVKQAGYVVTVGHNLVETDFTAALDAHAASSVDGTYGFDFGDSNAGFYDYEVGNGQFYLARYDANTQAWTNLIGLTPASAILPGTQTNHLEVSRAGSTITLYVNGQQVGQINDSALGQGDVGLAASGNSAPFDARFDNFVLYSSGSVVAAGSPGQANAAAVREFKRAPAGAPTTPTPPPA